MKITEKTFFYRKVSRITDIQDLVCSQENEKQSHRLGENKILEANHILDKEILSIIYKELSKSNHQKANNTIKKKSKQNFEWNVLQVRYTVDK